MSVSASSGAVGAISGEVAVIDHRQRKLFVIALQHNVMLTCQDEMSMTDIWATWL
jgi:hypothetical protein